MDWKSHLYVTFTMLETSSLIFYDETAAEQSHKRGGSTSVLEGEILFPKAQSSLDLTTMHKCCLHFFPYNKSDYFLFYFATAVKKLAEHVQVFLPEKHHWNTALLMS